MSSHESFGIMELFAEQLPETEELKPKLIEALGRKKPFRNFKDLIDDSDFRQDWFKFKHQEMKKFVEEQMRENDLI